jgi:transposase
MERELLEAWIAEGLSAEEIARRVGKHPSTVSYWLDKYGLRSAHAERHAPRGGIPREELAALVAQDLTVREIATRVGRSPTTVRYWLARHGLETTARARGKRALVGDAKRVLAECAVHGESVHAVRGDGHPRCARCSAEGVTRWRRRAKQVLVEEAGGRCQCCGYDGSLAALQFHHLDATTKRFAVGGRGLTRSLDVLREEAAKCILVCSNCHAEIESGARRLVA